MNESSIYAKLEFLRDQFINGKLMPCVDIKLEIDGQIFTQNVWLEPHELGNVVVVMLATNKLFISNKYCLGLIQANDGTNELLSNEQLWEIGIP
ncbi:MULTISPECIES: hypothetical protein [Pseudoalteromonas]|jgi:hypothetical protein|uniref:Uncharacterized protein n=1 Tax=Pseudoalteromonas neustonica TaxID=1840331 RepID=A0ABY3FJN0_9GAMM|nr:MULTISPECIES: hypothetical protein [Pseudoalteromonas]MBB1294816.1 hypothetical protein [Pseudoalteromonas sp. SR41-4]MBB1302698.1 hypothetical protein [Pseudoalteromonas sp. SR44-8]MBB1399170.1 hypothetical protein [Pseudoalteromonas sp. SG44-8]MBB1407582.1 hypothetical protein [Pseudoalteromonas sp. SG44-17]TVU86603.1 hypothetical protein FQP85_01390 [Pseudoalteromonas neustonica]|tara:strand:- start:530 stop:811 length:282 start_codon:yes stop_codon:yes gene_type:complete